MSKSKFKPDSIKASLRLRYGDDIEEFVTDDATIIHRRFRHLVTSFVLQGYVEPISVELLDCAGRIFKSYKQHF